jgi:chromosome partitioning protein
VERRIRRPAPDLGRGTGHLELITMTTTIAISSQKGGVAKTTTCLSLGACLAEMGKTVLLIDMDPQASLTLAMGLKPDELRRTVSDALLGTVSLVSVSRESPIFGLDIIPANKGLVVLDKILYGRKGYEYYLKNGLDVMGKGFYDMVLMDCPPSFGTLTLNALTAAHLLIIPTQCEFFAARSLRHVIELAKLVRVKTNSQLTYRVLVTMYDRRNKISQIILSQIQQGLKEVLFKTIIEVDTKLRESPAFGKPITLYAPNTRGAQQYRELAKELRDYG